MSHVRQCCSLIAAIVLVQTTVAAAASIDMSDPRRALGREDDVRIDAELMQDTVSPGASVGVTYQIANLSKAPIAVADRVATASYDPDTRTITVSIGAEVPQDGRMPHVVLIAPGEKKIFHAGANPGINASSIRATGGGPRQVEIKVSLLRDVAPFESLISSTDGRGGQLLPDALFDKWFESNDTVFLNAIPVHYTTRRSANIPEADAEQAGTGDARN